MADDSDDLKISGYLERLLSDVVEYVNDHGRRAGIPVDMRLGLSDSVGAIIRSALRGADAQRRHGGGEE